MSKLVIDELKLIETQVDQILPKLNILRKGFASHKTKDLNFRLDQLNKLRKGFQKYSSQIYRSNYLDLGFGEYSNDVNTMSVVLSDIDYIIKNFKSWAKPRSVDTPLALAPGKSYILPEPYGVVTIFGAWNSQYQTLFQPLVAAIAAGNVVLAKPSEMAPYSALLTEFILEELDPEIIQIVQGGVDQCIELNKHKCDLIVFTGSPFKGKIVSKAAAEHLTPCILELGGQNPVVVDEKADIKSTAYNICNGRFHLSGQLCIGPEYVMIHKSIFNQLKEKLKETVETFFTKNPYTCKDYSRMINEWHTNKQQEFLNTHGGKVVVGGGECNIKEKYVPPTIIEFDSLSSLKKSSLAKEEIFGPILYICPYTDIDECADYINANEKPLALYYFGSNSTSKDKIRNNTSSGAFVVNDTLVHFASHYLPFGGVGTSGYSAYHGKYGFDNMSHLKPVMEKVNIIIPFRYPPFTQTKLSIMRKLIGNLGNFTQFDAVKVGMFVVLLFAVYSLRANIYSGVDGFIHPKF